MTATRPIFAGILALAGLLASQQAFAITTSANPAAGPPIGSLPHATRAEIADFRHQADALYRMKEKAFVDEQAQPIVDHFYSKDAVSFGPDGKPVVGRAAFLEEYKQVVRQGNVKVEPISNHVGKDAAWEWVNFRVTQRDRAQKDFTFIMLFVWAKKDGRWICGGDAYTIGEFPKGN